MPYSVRLLAAAGQESTRDAVLVWTTTPKVDLEMSQSDEVGRRLPNSDQLSRPEIAINPDTEPPFTRLSPSRPRRVDR
jgi:hypothetical protein